MENNIYKNGYAIIDFKKTNYINLIQDQINLLFFSDPAGFHKKSIDDNQRLFLIKKTLDCIVERNLVKNLLLDNKACITSLLGLDVDIQTGAYLRISRPNLEGDHIDWHRDTFYGNSNWELNFWFPVFPLEEGAGLKVIEGSHLLPPNNVRHVKEQNAFRKNVTKGSLANELGFQYAPKSEDAIEEMDQSKIKLLRPEVGQAVLFFGHMIHRAQNFSTKTRVSIDVRVKHMLAPTNTKAGYYQPLLRSDIVRCIEKMNLIAQGELCEN
ncbi:MAG: phytanoyl-CoA dioxygenase family protein [Gammaproteobacteria bacterium]|nr:phytanoyl-CoA dioxygenase family protein [Gammaproteobacteria bacterium]